MGGTIILEGLSKAYSPGKGIFDLSLDVRQGEIFGFLGPNGAGKTTTIRHLIGFIRPDQGSCTIEGLDCWRQASRIQKRLGYLAGEIAFFDDISAAAMIDFVAAMRGLKDKSRIKTLCQRFDLDPRGRIRKMSKGMKQKVAIVCAFMHDPDILILDEPTSGLDPLMQKVFVELLLEEKKRGKTIFMSSHIFEEVEKTCERTAIIRQGRLAGIPSLSELRERQKQVLIFTFASEGQSAAFATACTALMAASAPAAGMDAAGPPVVRSVNQVRCEARGRLREILGLAAEYEITAVENHRQSLEEMFLHYYGGEEQ